MRFLRNGRQSIKPSGSVLISLIVILAFLSVLGLNLMTYLMARMTKTTLEHDRLQAYYLAEAGIASSVHELKTNLDYGEDGLGNIRKTPLGDGNFQAQHNIQDATITGLGEYNHITRRIQIKYSTL